MFLLKSDAYTALLYLLKSAPKNQKIDLAINSLQIALENHEQDVVQVLNLLTPILSDEALKESDPKLLKQLDQLKADISSIDFTQTSPEARFMNPLRRYLDSLFAIEMLTEPTNLMMDSVKKISFKIAGILKNYTELPPAQRAALDSFLDSLETLKGHDEAQAAISCGAFPSKVSITEVLRVLQDNSHLQLPQIMHIHFKFALLASREVPLNTRPTQPIGAFKEIIEAFEPRGYRSYFAKLANDTVNSKYNSYLANEVLYGSALFKAEPERGRAGPLDCRCLTQQLGLMRIGQNDYGADLPSLPLPWVPDAKGQAPNLKAKTVKDLIENDDLYVSGPSGMSCLLLHLMENMGNFSSIQEKQSYLAALCAYIVGPGFHSFHEVLGPAAYSLKLIPGYQVSPPDLVTDTRAAPANLNVFFEILSQFDKGFALMRDQVWDKYLSSKVVSRFYQEYQSQGFAKGYGTGVSTFFPSVEEKKEELPSTAKASKPQAEEDSYDNEM